MGIGPCHASVIPCVHCLPSAFPGACPGRRSDAASPILESRLESKNIALPVTERGLDGGLGGPGRGRTPARLVPVSWQLMDTRCTHPSRKKATPRTVPAMACVFKAQQPPTSPHSNPSNHPETSQLRRSRSRAAARQPALSIVPRRTDCCPNRDAAALVNTNVLSVRQAAGFPSAR